MPEESAKIDEEDVRLTAYFLWAQDGYPEGRAPEYWYRAWAQHRRMRACDDELRHDLNPDAAPPVDLPVDGKPSLQGSP